MRETSLYSYKPLVKLVKVFARGRAGYGIISCQRFRCCNISARYGIGIPEEEQKFLFNKFFRAKNTGDVQGTGLGLTIVKRYVELMGGQLSFVSKTGDEGTTFKIQIPNLMDE